MGSCLSRHCIEGSRSLSRAHSLRSERLSSHGAPATDLSLAEIIARGSDQNDHGVGYTGFRDLSALHAFNQTYPLPDFVYRAHHDTKENLQRYGLESSSTGNNSFGDPYLVKILKHTASTSGSGGDVMSFSGLQWVARRFNPGSTLVKVDTRVFADKFATTANILLQHADRLLHQGDISPAIVAKCLEKLSAEGEYEVFYLDGNVPPHAIVGFPDLTPG